MSIASFYKVEVRLEVSGAAVLHRAPTKVRVTEGSRRLRSYQKVKIDEAGSMAK
jgi:hypothetical protein